MLQSVLAASGFSTVKRFSWYLQYIAVMPISFVSFNLTYLFLIKNILNKNSCLLKVILAKCIIL